MPSNPKDQPTPRTAKERILAVDQPQGLELEGLILSLTDYVEAVDSIRNFEMTKEWLEWKRVELSQNSPQKEIAKLKVLDKLNDIRRKVDIGVKDIDKMINFYKAEVESR